MRKAEPFVGGGGDDDVAAIGRPRKYTSVKALREAVDRYWDSISYQVPAMVSTPTGEVDEKGRILWKAKLLNEKFDGSGKPKTVVKYLEPPSVPGLLLYLGISKSTWSAYRGDEKLGAVVAYWDARYEAYLVDRLETGKHISGVMFNLSYNFGWKDKREISLDRETRRAVTASGMTLEEKRALLEAAARDFGGTPHPSRALPVPPSPLPSRRRGTSHTDGACSLRVQVEKASVEPLPPSPLPSRRRGTSHTDGACSLRVQVEEASGRGDDD